MTHKYIPNKCVVISALLSLSAILFLPIGLLAQGAVVGYADGNNRVNANNLMSFPSTAQLGRLTHVIAFGLGVDKPAGTLKKSNLPGSWNGNTNTWLESLASRAHQKGLNLSICISGKSEFNDATKTTQKLNAFVNEIVSFVNDNGLDGVDINWERPGADSNNVPLPSVQDQINEWNRCIALLSALKSALPYKRISISLPHGNWIFPNLSIQMDIWHAVDAIYLMTYDVEDGEDGWPSHSNANYSIGGIDNWITGGTPISYKGKLFLGCAFYGYKKDSNGNTIWGDGDKKVNYATYSGVGSYNRGDLPADVQNKAIHTRDNGFVGVFIWELGYDVPANQSNSLLKALYDVMPSFSGPTIVCNSATRFQLNNRPAGVTVSWSFSQNLVSASGWEKCLYSSPCIYLQAANASAGGTGWVQATISGPCADVVLPKHDVWVGVPKEPSDIFGFTYDGMQFNSNSEYGFWAITHYSQQINYYEWFVTGGTIQYGQGTQHLHVKTGNASFSNNFSVELRTDNNCGISPTLYRYGYLIPGGGDPFESDTTQHNDKLKLAISPNPASSNITISEVLRSNESNPWHLRLLNQQGTILVETTASLPNSISLQGLLPGAYVLHAIQGQYVEQQVVLVK